MIGGFSGLAFRGISRCEITNQWRMCFPFVDGDAYDAEIVDYH